MESVSTVKVKVQRGTSENNWYQEYQVPAVQGQSVYGMLEYIYDHLDSSLAFSASCRIGLCSDCLVRVNGKVVRACTTIPQGDILIEPYKHTCVSRDLVVTAYA